MRRRGDATGGERAGGEDGHRERRGLARAPAARCLESSSEEADEEITGRVVGLLRRGTVVRRPVDGDADADDDDDRTLPNVGKRNLKTNGQPVLEGTVQRPFLLHS